MLAIILAAVIVVADQISKFFVLRDLKPIVDVPLWDGVFHLHYAENTGAAFSILQHQQWVFYIFNSLAVIFIIFLVFKEAKRIGVLGILSLGMIMGGAVGNLIDRFRFGYVVDFLYFKLINFAIFNVADSCITVGAILLAVYVLFVHENNEELSKASTEQPEGEKD